MQNSPRHHIARRKLAHGVILGHEAMHFKIAQVSALAPQRFRKQESRGILKIESRRMKLDKLHVADFGAGAKRGRNPTLRQLRGRILDLTFSQHYYASSVRQFNCGPQTGNSRTDDNEISFGWSALHMAKMLPLCLHGGFACDYVMMNAPWIE